jgi:hypothetical protein
MGFGAPGAPVLAGRKPLAEGRGSGGSAMVEAEQSAESFRFADVAVSRTARLVGERNNIGEALVIAFVLMVGQIFLEGIAQGALTEKNQLIETLLLD